MYEKIKLTRELFFQNNFKAYILIIVSIISIFLEGFSYATILPLLESYLGSQELSNLSRTIDYIFNYLGFSTNIISISIIFLILIFLKNFFRIFREYLTVNYKYYLREIWLKKTYKAMDNTDYEKIISINRGKLFNNVFHETNNATQGMENLIEIFTTIASIVIFVTILLLTSIKFTLLIASTAALILLLNRILLYNYSRKIGNKEVELNQLVSSVIHDSLVSIKNIKSFNVMSDFSKYLNGHVSYLRKIMVQWRVYTFSTMPIIETFLVLVIITFVIYWNVYNNSVETLVPLLAVIVVVGQRLMQQLSRLLIAINSFNRMKRSFNIISELINFDKANKIFNNESIKDKIILDTIKEDIQFNNISFNYQKSKTANLLQNINLKIKYGKITLLKGKSGSGKSTFLDLLSGLLKPDEGEIKINKINLNKYSNISEKITTVSQKNILITDTIKDNISFFYDKADEKNFKNVSKKLNVEDFVQNFDDGYNTVIENSGENLSGGQTQRICIARALLRKPEILILDEITSSLDEKNEKEIFNSIFEIMRGKTIVISIHKDVIDDLADEIFNIDNGKLTKIK